MYIPPGKRRYLDNVFLICPLKHVVNEVLLMSIHMFSWITRKILIFFVWKKKVLSGVVHVFLLY